MFPIGRYTDENAFDIHEANTGWTKLVNTLLKELKRRKYTHVAFASSVYDWYVDAIGTIEVTRYTFPNTELAAKMSTLSRHLPREYRLKRSLADLTDEDRDRILHRIAMRYDLHPPVARKKCNRRM